MSKMVNVTTLADILAARKAGCGPVPLTKHGPPMGYEILNALAEVFDLPMDCTGLDIHVRIDDVLRISVHRIAFVETKEPGKLA